MAATPSTMIPLGTEAPFFELPDTVSGKIIDLHAVQGKKATVVMFICNHCPYVKLLNDAIVSLANSLIPKGISFVAISSNDAAQYPDDGPVKMKDVAQQLRYPFPYLYDETQAVAKSYDAACTPDFFVFDKDLKLTYRGQFDDARPGNNQPVTGKDLRKALEDMLAGREPSPDQKPSIGCNIKWRK
jgi:peroxiredoxin